MSGIVKTANLGSAFDVNRPLSTSEALAFKNNGYDTCIRYIPRTSALTAGNLTGVEIESILAAGLDLSVVQHVGLPGWDASEELGEIYGKYAGEYCHQIGLPQGVSVWLDLEEVAPHTAVDAYCRAWYIAVKAAGYVPGIYVGYACGLTDEDLYLLPFKNYWAAYNCDNSIPVRGFQIIQHIQKTLNGIFFDPNTIAPDNLGVLPFVLSP